MIEALNSSESRESDVQLLAEIERYVGEVRAFLPEIPKDLKVYFSQDFLNPDTGVGGFAYDKETITISFDYLFEDKARQKHELRGIVFHELFHLAQGYFALANKMTALEESIYEGAATVFQRDIADISWVGKYGDDHEMLDWVTKITALGKDFDWYQWKVHDEVSGRDAILYATGAFIVDKALEKSGVSIVALRDKNPKDILKMAELPT